MSALHPALLHELSRARVPGSAPSLKHITTDKRAHKHMNTRTHARTQTRKPLPAERRHTHPPVMKAFRSPTAAPFCGQTIHYREHVAYRQSIFFSRTKASTSAERNATIARVRLLKWIVVPTFDFADTHVGIVDIECCDKEDARQNEALQQLDSLLGDHRELVCVFVRARVCGVSERWCVSSSVRSVITMSRRRTKTRTKTQVRQRGSPRVTDERLS